MTVLGQLCLLAAMVACGYAAFACAAGWRLGHRGLSRSGVAAAVAGVAALTVVATILGWALVGKDFRFAYVVDYSSRELPWHYSLSAFWGGQAGSLLLWAWLLGLLALAYRFGPRREASPLVEPTFAVLLGYLGFLVAMMAFGADPMEPSTSVPSEGAGLGPSLQHPAMLVHPPVIFLGYAGWAVPFALAVAGLAAGRLDAHWVRQTRPWVLFSWLALGIGILLGAQWAYEELGWGGYWGWDPVENGSLIPWLTGTALVHVLLAWRYRGVLKKTAVLLAIATFGLCNFATFLTRSGIFSSLHAFSQSPLGWMFLVFMAVLAVGGGVLVAFRRGAMMPDHPIPALGTREALVAISAFALVLLAAVALVGTLMIPLSQAFFGERIVVGAAFYNNVLMPIGLLLLAATGIAPLVNWGTALLPAQKRTLLLATFVGAVSAGIALATGIRHPMALAVAGLAALAVAAMAAALILDARRRDDRRRWLAVLSALRSRPRQYAGFLVHLGFVSLAVGVTGSSLGTHERELDVRQGESIEWTGYSVRFTRLFERDLPGKTAVEAQLDVARNGLPWCTLLPAQHFHRLQNHWTSRVAVHAAWTRDLYAILHRGQGNDRIHVTLIENPLMRWIWLGGCVMTAGALVGLVPAGRFPAPPSSPPGPHVALRRKRLSPKASRAADER